MPCSAHLLFLKETKLWFSFPGPQSLWPPLPSTAPNSRTPQVNTLTHLPKPVHVNRPVYTFRHGHRRVSTHSFSDSHIFHTCTPPDYIKSLGQGGWGTMSWPNEVRVLLPQHAGVLSKRKSSVQILFLPMWKEPQPRRDNSICLFFQKWLSYTESFFSSNFAPK